jgi:hypothetical protein
VGNPQPVPLTDEARARGRATQARNREARRLEQQRELENREAPKAALDALVEVVSDRGQPTSRLAAAKEILDRYYGKPTADTDDDQGGPTTVVFRFESAFSVPMDAGVIEGEVTELPPATDRGQIVP